MTVKYFIGCLLMVFGILLATQTDKIIDTLVLSFWYKSLFSFIWSFSFLMGFELAGRES
jgi:hypothetical protein